MLIKECARIIQGLLYVFGISIHNKITDECVHDFSCCYPELKSSFKKRHSYFHKDVKRIFRM